MNTYEFFAANCFLSEFPLGISLSELVDKILADDPDVTVWEPFENYPKEWIVNEINVLIFSLADTFTPKEQL